MSSSDVMLERETANDEEAQVVAIHVLSGTAVLQGDVIFDIENSKATQEVVAPRAGILVHALEIGQNVDFGVVIARIVSAEELADADGENRKSRGIDPYASNPGRPPQELPTPGLASATTGVSSYTTQRYDLRPIEISRPVDGRLIEPRVSHAAATMLADSGLETTVFGTDFITTRDILAYLKPDQRRAPANDARSSSVAVPKAGQPVPGRKRAEIEALSTGAGGSMLSVLGISLGALRVAREPGSFLAGRITDLVIYEASRLMRKYPRLNAYYQDGHIAQHDAVHAGLAIDSGGRLMVYGIENADIAALPDLADIIEDAVARYVDNALTAAELSLTCPPTNWTSSCRCCHAGRAASSA
jgi:pyruvate/2-oxoglutarate dehydrogenase complex dihydrolipoamide acyltransferase (E2) component